ncbi:MAG: amidohydrolase, partial [Acidobacteria bacterium 37-65-4]
MKLSFLKVAALFVFVVVLAPLAFARQPIDLAVVGGTVLTMNAHGDILHDGYVAISKDRIVAIGRRSDLEKKYHPAQTISASGELVMPGLVNTHTHVAMSLFRGIANDLALKDWLENYIFPAEARNVTRDFVYWGTLLGDLEMIQSGTTTFADMYYFEDEVARATKQAGMRGVLGETFIDFPAPDNKTFDEALSYTRKFFDE